MDDRTWGFYVYFNGN